MKRKPKSLPKLKNELQEIFNSYIRLRDEGKPCISCNQTGKYLQAGHYFPVQGYDGLRFDEFNVNGECIKCNCFDEGHLIGYGDNLTKRIGIESMTWLKDVAAEYKRTGNKWSRSQLEGLIEVYKQKIKERGENS
jgi:hypothetical protein